jgi:hypothetical protein
VERLEVNCKKTVKEEKSVTWQVQKIKDKVTKPNKMAILTLQVKVFFLHVYLCRAFVAFCCSSAVPNAKWSHGLPLLGDRT